MSADLIKLIIFTAAFVREGMWYGLYLLLSVFGCVQVVRFYMKEHP